MMIPLLLGALLLAQSGRTPVPDVAKQKEAEKTIKDLFKSEYAKKTPAERRELSRALLAQAEKSADDPALQWVLLREAQELALQGGDLEAAFGAAEKTGKIFDTDPLALQSAALAAAAKTARQPEECAILAERALKLADAAAAADAYEAAEKAASTAVQLARGAANPVLGARAAQRSKEIGDTKTKYNALKRSRDTLAQNPADPAANLEVAQFLCFVKGDWENGLDYLSKGGDAKLRGLAGKDLAKPATAEDQVAVGDGWWDLSEGEKPGPKKGQLQSRARFWYEQALPGAPALARVRIEKRLAALEAASGDPSAVNLLSLVDLKLDVSTGAWEKSGSSLTAPAPFGKIALVRLPYGVPAEYDLRIVVASAGGNAQSLDIGLIGPSTQFSIVVDGGGQTGLHGVDGKNFNENETLFKEKIFVDEKPRTLLVSVRKSGVAFTVDGRSIFSWKGDPAKLNAPPYPDLKEKRQLFLGAWQAYRFTRIELITVSGSGKKIR